MCDQPATIHHTWGLFTGADNQPRKKPYQQADLCQQHGDDLWSRIAQGVNSLLVHYKAEAPNGVNVDPWLND